MIALSYAEEGHHKPAAEARRAAVALGHPATGAACAVDAARASLQLGQVQRALTALDRVDPSQLDPATRGDWLTARGHALVANKDVDAAAKVLADAVAAHRVGDERGLGAALFLLGQVEGMRGNGQACGEALGEALLITARLGLPEQRVIRAAIERIHAQAGQV